MEDRMTAQKLKNSILQMAVQGKLVPQDPNDEPASVLLERIRKEKEQLIKEGKIKKNKNESYIFRGADNLHYEQIGKEVRCIEDELPFEIPNNWEWNTIGYVFSLQAGKNIDSSKISERRIKGSYPCFGGNGIRGYVNEKNHNGDYPIIGRQGALCGNIKLASGEFYATEHAVCVSTFASTNVKWVCIFLTALELNQYATATAQPGLAVANINRVLIPIPPKNEQERIVNKINELEPLIEKYKQVEEKLYELNSNIKEQLKKSIFQYAIEGKLVPQDPNDEPASVLLKRIHEEKSKLIAEGKIKKEKNASIIYRRDNSYYEKLQDDDKCIDEEVLYSIPDSWSFTRQSAICWLDNGTPSKGEKLPYLEAKVIRSIKEPDFKLSGVIVNETDKVILVDGENSGEVFNIPYKGYMGSTFKLLRQSSLMSEDYIQLIFELYRDLYKNNKKGAAIPHLDKELFKTLLIPIPPVKEQNRIVDSMVRLRSQIGLL